MRNPCGQQKDTENRGRKGKEGEVHWGRNGASGRVMERSFLLQKACWCFICQALGTSFPLFWLLDFSEMSVKQEDWQPLGAISGFWVDYYWTFLAHWGLFTTINWTTTWKIIHSYFPTLPFSHHVLTIQKTAVCGVNTPYFMTNLFKQRLRQAVTGKRWDSAHAVLRFYVYMAISANEGLNEWNPCWMKAE